MEFEQNDHKEKIVRHFVTKDYECFKRDIMNRPVDRFNVEKLKESIKKNNLITFRAVEVFPDGTIFDGQHRVEALKELGLPVEYRIIPPESVDVHDLIRLNQNLEKWNVGAFLNVFGKVDSPYIQSYVRFMEDMETVKLPTSTILFICFGHSDSKYLKAGTLKYSEKDSESLRSFLEKLEVFNIYPFYRQHRFIKAAKFIFGQPDYNHEHLKKQLQKYFSLIPSTQKIVAWKVAVNQIKQLYEYRCSKCLGFSLGDLDPFDKS